MFRAAALQTTHDHCPRNRILLFRQLLRQVMLLNDGEEDHQDPSESPVTSWEPVLLRSTLKRSRKVEIGRERNKPQILRSFFTPPHFSPFPLLHRISPRFYPVTLQRAPDANPLYTQLSVPIFGPVKCEY